MMLAIAEKNPIRPGRTSPDGGPPPARDTWHTNLKTISLSVPQFPVSNRHPIPHRRAFARLLPEWPR
jgi:hypothetical protein